MNGRIQRKWGPALSLLVAVVSGGSFATGLPLATKTPLRVLRVCADPDALPYSNERGEGFENRIADIVARQMGKTVAYTWRVQRRGFVRSTLDANVCDVMIGAPIGWETLLTTRPYYRSTFAFLTRKARNLGDLTSFDDARLPVLRIGVPLAGDDGANPAPLHALARRGLTAALRGFPLYDELGRTLPAAAEAVAKGEIDVAILWGPVAGFAARTSKEPLVAVSVREEAEGAIPFTFAIGMGVRKGDRALADELEAALTTRRDAITAVLRRAGVPLLPIIEPTERGE
jgi:mxaJ protein